MTMEDKFAVELTWKQIQALSSLITMEKMTDISEKERDFLLSIQEILNFTNRE